VQGYTTSATKPNKYTITLTEQLDTHEVITRGDTTRHSKIPPAAIRNHGINSPLTPTQPRTRNLEPTQPARTRRSRIADFGEVDLDGALVRFGDRVVRIIRTLGATYNVAPERTDLCACGDCDDCGGAAETRVACDGSVRHALNGLVEEGA
jgi:hypothetical protein